MIDARLLAAVVPTGLLDVRAIDYSRQFPAVQRFFPAGDMDAIARFAATYAERELYFGVVSRDREDGSIRGCGDAYAVFIDIDFKDTPEQAARDRISAFPLPPSSIVLSGGGLHVYWFLSEPYDLRSGGATRFKNVLRRACLELGGDIKCAEPVHILRIPGTENHKYGTPRTVAVENFTPELRYSLADFESVLAPLPPPKETTIRVPSLPADLGDDEIIDKAFRATNGEKFRSLFLHGAISAYSSHSEADMALCSMLAFWTQDESQLDRLFRRSALYREDKWDTRTDYRQRTITAAISRTGETYSARRSTLTTRSVPVAAEAKDIVATSDLRDRVLALFANGLKPGVSPGIENLARHWTLRPGDWTLVTGIPSHGKSAAMDNVMMNTAMHQGWRWAVWSAENLPHELHVSNLVSLYCGKPFSAGITKRVSRSELQDAMDFIESRFDFLAPPEEQETIDRLLADTALILENRPVNGLLIDPWNELTHFYQDTETEHISRNLKKIGRFAKAKDVHVVVVAHPMKLRKNPDGKYPIPTPYDVAGSAHFRNKADCALCVWRDETQPGTATIYVQKIRRRFVGKIGEVPLSFDVVTGRFIDPNQREESSDEHWQS